MIWTTTPEDAWTTHMLPVLGTPGWVEDSSGISDEIGLSKRELLGLILIAHALRKQSGTAWLVGYDPADGDQNDGHVTDGEKKRMVEHKIVAQMDSREVLEAIKSTYTKYANKGGAQYGKDRILIIQPNKNTSHGGLVEISELRELIANESPFDQVLTTGVTAQYDDRFVWHLVQHYPENPQGMSGMTQIDLYWKTGKGCVLSEGIRWELS